jgi:hypothetical protein
VFRPFVPPPISRWKEVAQTGGGRTMARAMASTRCQPGGFEVATYWTFDFQQEEGRGAEKGGGTAQKKGGDGTQKCGSANI